MHFLAAENIAGRGLDIMSPLQKSAGEGQGRQGDFIGQESSDSSIGIKYDSVPWIQKRCLWGDERCRKNDQVSLGKSQKIVCKVLLLWSKREIF